MTLLVTKSSRASSGRKYCTLERIFCCGCGLTNAIDVHQRGIFVVTVD